MGGCIEWSAIPLMIELHDITDQDVVDFLDRLEQLREYHRQQE